MNKLYVVGIGPGERKKRTMEAEEILAECEVIAGYQVYIDLIKEQFPEKTYLVNGMTQERERCRLALQAAEEGKKTAMVCSGDAGVYGMAGILLEMGEAFPTVEIEVVAGVSAALSGGALLGAPLGHDFAVISLSDRLTSWEKIEQRLRGAALADFVICLYNPASRSRKEYLRKACDIILEYRQDKTVCGFARNIGRQGEEHGVLTLEELREMQADMFTTVFIGNSMTRNIQNRMVTPRGYRLEKK